MSSSSRQHVFLMNIGHESYLRGEQRRPAALMTGGQALQQFLWLYILITLPIILIITLTVALAGHRINLLLPIEIISGLLICLVIVLRRFYRDRRLEKEGRVIYGSIIHRDDLPLYTSASGSITRLYYRFQPSEQDSALHRFDLPYPGNHLPDGRKFPEAGTVVAVLYVDKNNHILL